MPAQVILIGGVAVRDGSMMCPLPGRRCQLCLAALATRPGTVVTREELADVLWDGEPPQSWPAALRNTVARLRSILQREASDALTVHAHTAGYRLALASGATVDIAVLQADVAVAETALRDGDMAQALALAEPHLQSDARPLDGLTGEWADQVRGHVDDARHRLALAAAEAALATGDHARADRYAARVLAQDPLHEAALRLRMRALIEAGGRELALRLYEALRRRLAEELGARPAPATQAVAAALGSQDGTGAQRRVTAAATRLLAVDGSTPLVGRTQQLAQLTALLRAARTGCLQIAAVHGEPGSGKSRLAAAVAATAHREGMSVLYGRAGDRLSVGYDGFADALADWVAAGDPSSTQTALGRHAAVLSELIPTIPAVPDQRRPHAPGADRAHTMTQAITHTLARAAGIHGAVLILDDMQAAGEPALGALAALPDALSDTALLVLVLHRARTDPVCGIVEPGAERLELPPLCLDDVQALAPDADPQTVEKVWRDSGGNALLVTELLHAPGLTPTGRAADRLAALVRHRLAELPAPVVTVVQLAAVAGETFDPRVVAAAAGVPAQRATQLLTLATHAGILTTAPGSPPGWLGFRHGLLRSALLATIPEGEQRRLHHQLGVALESADPAGGRAPLRLADHFTAAAATAGWQRAVRYGVSAARAAYDAGVYGDAAGIAGRALDLLDRVGNPDASVRADLEVVRGGALRALGEPEGRRLLGEAFRRALAAGDATRAADAVLMMSEDGTGSDEAYFDDALLTPYQEALEALGDDESGRRARLLGHIASGHSWRANPLEGRRAAEAAVELARRHGDPLTLLAVLTTARRCLVGLSDVTAQRALEDELETLACTLDSPSAMARVMLWRFETDVQAGEGGQLERTLVAAERHVRELPAASQRHHLAYTRASLALLRGRLLDAEQLVERAAAVGRHHGLAAPIVEAIRLTQLTGLRAEQGRVGELADELVEFFGATGVAEWQGMVAIGEYARGRLSMAAQALDCFLDAYIVTGPTLITPVALLALMTPVAVGLGDRGRCARVSRLLQAYAGRGAYVAHFAGPIDQHLGALAVAGGDAATAHAHFTRATAFATRLGAPRWAARITRRASMQPTG